MTTLRNVFTGAGSLASTVIDNTAKNNEQDQRLGVVEDTLNDLKLFSDPIITNFTGDGSTLLFNVPNAENALTEHTFVDIDGSVQTPEVDFVMLNGTLAFTTTAPALYSKITVRTLIAYADIDYGITPIVQPSQIATEGQTDFNAPGASLGIVPAPSYRVAIDGLLQRPGVDYSVFEPGRIRFDEGLSINSQVDVTFFEPRDVGDLVGDVSNGSVLATGTTQVRSLEDRFSDVINVKDFGAAGDGVTDDTSAFESALLLSKTIYIPDGIFLVGELNVNSKTTIFGNGQNSIIKCSSSNLFVVDSSDFEMFDLSIDSNNTRIVYCDPSDYVDNHNYRNLTITTVSSPNRHKFLYSTAINEKGWTNISFNNVNGISTGVASTNANFISFDHSTTGTESTCNNFNIINCDVIGHTSLVSTSGNGNSQYLKVQGCSAKSCSKGGINTYHCYSVDISNNSINGCSDYNYLWLGITTTSSRTPSKVVNNIFQNSNTDGALFEQAHNAIISDNVFSNNTNAGSVIGASCRNTVFANNSCTRNRYGILVDSQAGGISSSSYGFFIEGCRIWGNVRDGILIAGKIERIEIKNSNIEQNATGNSSFSNKYSSIRYDKTFKWGALTEASPQINSLIINSCRLGGAIVGSTDINDYTESSVLVESDVSIQLIITDSTFNSNIGSSRSEIEITPDYGRLFITGSTKRTANTKDLYDVLVNTILYVNSCCDWDGNNLT